MSYWGLPSEELMNKYLPFTSLNGIKEKHNLNDVKDFYTDIMSLIKGMSEDKEKLKEF
jgi:pantothenate kinase